MKSVEISSIWLETSGIMPLPGEPSTCGEAKNLLILYDAVGTLADAVGPELDTPRWACLADLSGARYKQQLLEPLFQKFQSTPAARFI